MDRDSRELKFTVPWGHVAAKAWGSPEKKRVLAVHGTLDNAGSFTNLCKLLPDKYFIVAIDLPGHGFSTHFPRGMNLDFFNYVYAIKYVLDELEWNKCLYIGHSFGGQLGTVFSIIYPERLEKMISLDAILPRSISNDELLIRIKEVSEITFSHNNSKEEKAYSKEAILNALKTRRYFSLNDSAIEALFERAVTKVGDDLYKYNRDIRMRIFLVPNLNRDQYAELMKYAQTPTLIILATNSWFNMTEKLESDLKFCKKIMPHHYVISVVNGNHDVHNNNPERIVSMIVDFFENDSTNIKSKL
ncbi:serine hydrolase-like protein [Chelonus insularis]|uniref:serine hydrolase-like protein n=1 Tax=Chelonus insularis TaxID=460826 RepID=UPI00158C0029|nr:serine hydrolase-like protein [Chelonus insularis]